MRIVLSWLREFCPTDLSADELAEALTAKGIHVDGIERPWARLAGVVVARVLEVRDHPGGDKLCIARIDTGSGEREVVVGVRNMAAGDAVPYAGPGATVPGLPEPLFAREIRGVVSEGMLCSPREVGLSADHSGILVLDRDERVGADVAEALDLDDVVLDIEVEANRPDLLSVVGVAREAAMATGTQLTAPPLDLVEGDEKAEAVASVEIRDRERCPRYLARVIRGVRIGGSPLRAQARLTAAGMRPISNVVDATNYALLEWGHPLHPFDLDRLEGRGIVVRRAEEGERLSTLDGVERTLSREDLVIAGHGKAVAIAGIMGSAAAEVSASTNGILLESASFDPVGVLRTARRLGLRTEAAIRFERGTDPEAVPVGADRAAALIAAWSGGTVLAGAIDVGEAPPRRRVALRPERASLLLGYPVTGRDVREALGRLRIEAEERDGVVEVEVPGYRVDLEREVDLIEEVARVRGYDEVPSALPGVRQLGGMAPSSALRRRIRETLVRGGVREATSNSFSSQAELRLMGFDPGRQPRVANPLVAEEAYLRASLVPGLVRSLARNRSRQVPGAALFEVGHVFRPEEERPDEREEVALAMHGRVRAGWGQPDHDLDFFDAKGALEDLFDGLGIREWSLGGASADPLHPGRSAEVLVGGDIVGAVGELTPEAASAFDLTGRVAVAWLSVAALADRAGAAPVFADLARFPPVRRHLAFTVDRATPAGEVLAAAGDAVPSELLADVTLFDVFEGPPLVEGTVSLAFAVDLRAPDRTLTDDEADAVVRRIADRLAERFGAEWRSA